MGVQLSGKANTAEKKADAKKKIEYSVLEECGTFDTKEYTLGGEIVREELKLRFVQWSKGEPRYDLRWWIYKEDSEIPGKGIGMTGEILIALGDKIKEMQDGEPKKAKATTKAKSAACSTTTTKRTTKTTTSTSKPKAKAKATGKASAKGGKR